MSKQTEYSFTQLFLDYDIESCAGILLDERIKYIIKRMKHFSFIQVQPEKTGINVVALAQVIERYRRDVWSYKQILEYGSRCINVLPEQKEFIKILKSGSFRVPSDKPEFEKKLAFLLYHLAHFKPFYFNMDKKDDKMRDELACYNEIVSYMIIDTIVRENMRNNIQMKISITKKQLLLLLRSLSVRKISWSSLELTFYHIITPQ